MRTPTYFFALAVMVILSSCGQTETAEASTPEAVNSTAPAAAPDRATEPMEDAAGLKIGDIAPYFELEGTDGNMHSLATTMNANGNAPKGYVVTCTCNTCPYAKIYEDRLVALHEKLSPMWYPVIAIQPNDIEIKPDDNLDAMKS
ncbi:MAG: hypothetical protein AAF597_14755 [Bacteroidota bacterium]